MIDTFSMLAARVFMKDVLQLIQQYTQSHNQAWRAAAGVV